jgi:hypothetical protein
VKRRIRMVTDSQVRLLMKLIKEKPSLKVAAAKAGMDEKTARKYRDIGKLPSQVRAPHTWRTRPDPFSEVWDEVRAHLEVNPGLEAKTLFEDLQRRYPGRFQDGQLRTLQRRVKTWRAVEGPSKEIFFAQRHEPGELSQSDFTSMNELEITIEGKPFPHLLYHFVLTYSNWETGTVCFSESFESLSLGLQNALWELGGVPRAHQTDRLSAAVQKVEHPEEFTRHYDALLRHYGLEGKKSQARKANENGDVEQRHHRVKRAVEQALLLRGSREFTSRREYQAFLAAIFAQLNAGRAERLKAETKVLRRLPAVRLDGSKRVEVRVGPGSTIRVQHNVYSVHSRLIGEKVVVRIHAERLDVIYAQRVVETLPRLRGRKQHRIQYRHVIDWLVRKPGAFHNYRYREDLFPTSWFRMAYDSLVESMGQRADKEYLGILALAARESESLVNYILQIYLNAECTPSLKGVEEYVRYEQQLDCFVEPEIKEVDLASYDGLLEDEEAAA